MKYKDYLKSPEWRCLRKAARERAGGCCELCGGAAEHVHHVRYPKRFKDDHLNNLVVLCSYCHQLSHGIREEPGMSDQYETRTFTFPGQTGEHRLTLYINKADKKRCAEIPVKRVIEILYAEEVRGNSAYARMFADYKASIELIKSCVRPKYLRELLHSDGSKEWMILQPGVYQLLGSSMLERLSASARFQDWLYEEVLPAIHQTGGYQMQGNKPSDGLVAQARQLLFHAERIEKLEEEQEKIRFSQAMIHEEHALESRRLDKVIEELHIYTGGDYHRTARLWLAENKLPANYVQSLGYRATCIAKARGLKLGEKIAEGTFMVNQYPKEILHEAALQLGIIGQDDFFNE